MDADGLVAGACAAAGRDDFGAPQWREGLDRLVEALEAEAQLSELGVVALEAQITRNLVNRLEVTGWLADHPEALATPVARPLVVLGLPRTGTTLLSELLHRDPANRSLLRWEAASSVPPPDAATMASDPRLLAAREEAAGMEALNPGFKAIHYEAPDGPTECVAILAQDFKSLLWSVVANVESYTRWLLECDETSAYGYHHRVLALLQSRAPGRWALKTPHHALAVDALVAEYPDARLIMTHRDPATVVASTCSLARSLASTFTDGDHTTAFASVWSDVTQAIVDHVMRWRDANGDDRFVDVSYEDLVADPVGTVRGVYTRFGEELSPEAEESMQRYMTEHPRGEHGRHEYSLAEVGLRADELDARFARYRDRFGIPRQEHAA
jgi:hypothetical protein